MASVIASEQRMHKYVCKLSPSATLPLKCSIYVCTYHTYVCSNYDYYYSYTDTKLSVKMQSELYSFQIILNTNHIM